MILKKAVIAEMAIEGYARKRGFEDRFRTNNSCGSVEFAFTEDVPQDDRDDFIETMRCIEAALGVTQPIFFASGMSVVTRKTRLWGKL